jgi:hypothetical protein
VNAIWKGCGELRKTANANIRFSDLLYVSSSARSSVLQTDMEGMLSLRIVVSLVRVKPCTVVAVCRRCRRACCLFYQGKGHLHLKATCSCL